jgi:acyl-CoA reductase-like NAD-dependent aldehyde dehydrogenase
LAKLAAEAGIPAGVFNVVTGFGHEAGEALALHPDVDAIGFTGSTRVGRKMLEYSGRSNLKRVYNELGGKTAFVVFDDGANLHRAADTIAGAIFYNQGESCNAPSRLVVQKDVAKTLIDRIVAEAARYQPHDPLSEKSTMGALVDRQQLTTVMGYVAAGIKEGATLATGGTTALEATGGYYVNPTVFVDVKPNMKIAQEEIFGPVLSVITFANEAEALAIANGTDFGLQASLWSGNLNRIHRVSQALQAGTVHVNQYDEDDITVPFGGVKQSGNGRDKSLHALEKYTELKTIWMRMTD